MKNVRKLFLLTLLPLIAACTLPASSEMGDDTTDTSSVDVQDNYYQPNSLNLSLKEVFDTQETEILNSVGEQKILVIPVDFSDKTCASEIAGGCEVGRQNIQKAFFGQSEETGWESVSSYYKKSSYGKLNITGTVTDWYHADVTSTQLQAKYSDSYEPTWYVLDKAVAWYKAQTGSKLTEYDLDNDGYLDAVWLVYSLNEKNVSNYDNIYWAYTYWQYNNRSNINSPTANVYAWASYNFLNEGGYSTPTDAHTFIHETGHILGLDDYYNYDNAKSFLGRVDMMDYNVGDHNAYSKMLLKWTTPKVVTDSGEITLRPFESSGDCILLRDSSWNNSAFDEYLLLEFYTPTGLNAKDLGGYSGTRTYSKPAIKVIHIDSRLVKAKWSTTGMSYPINPYTDEIYSSGSYFTAIGASNTPSSSYKSTYYLAQLLTSSGNAFASYSSSTDNDLFYLGDSFAVNTFTAFSFNDGSKPGFSFIVSGLNADSATITFTKK